MSQELSFHKNLRLLNSSAFSPVFDQPSFKIHHQQFLILAKFNSYEHPRLGIVVAKKNAKLAVSRNQIKRQIRESFRLKQHNLPPIDAIVLARRGCDQLTKETTREILDSLWKRAAKKANKILKESNADS